MRRYAAPVFALALLTSLLPASTSLLAQSASTPIAATAATPVPALVPYSGTVREFGGKAGELGATFLIFKDEQGGEPLWAETQTVVVDAADQFKAQLGATYPNGLPVDLFATGEARWLEVQIAGQPAQARVLLASVPYALKAADAATLGGLPASAFALAGGKNFGNAIPAITPDAASNVTTTGGTAGYIPEFSGASMIVDSPLFVLGADVGVDTATPAATLDVAGTALVEGGLTVDVSATFNGPVVLAPTGKATTAKSYSSEYLKFEASAYNSSSKSVVEPRFQLQTEVQGNDTASPTGTLNLLASSGSAAPVETGFSFNTSGIMTFASGQTFPGTGPGTITGVTAGTALTGGGTSGPVTLNVDTTKVPLLAANNAFTGSETVAGSLSAGSLAVSGTASAGTVNSTNGYYLNGALFAFGSQSNDNEYFGFAGNLSNTGTQNNTGTGFQALSSNISGNGNVANGSQALFSNTSGSVNDAVGYYALYSNTEGSFNVADGYYALYGNTTGAYNTGDGIYAIYSNTTGRYNVGVGAGTLSYSTTGSDNVGVGHNAGDTADSSSGTGSFNTAIGSAAEFGTGSISNATAVGANAIVSQSNALVLGQTTAGSPGASYVNVGIGTDTPRSTLEAAVSNSGGLGPVLTLTNSGGSSGAAAAVDFNTYLPQSSGTYNPAARIEALDDNDFSDDLVFLSNVEGGKDGGLKQNMVIKANGQVGIGTTTPDSLLSVNGSADKPGGGSWGTYSDMRLKTVNGSFSSGLDQVMRIRPIRYRYNADNGMGIRDRDEHVGVVAQEVQRVIPEAVTENSKGYLLVNNDPILWSMVNAIQEQQREIAAQQKLIRAQSQMVKSLTAEVRETRKTLRQVKELAASGQGTMVASK